jgi:putative pyruvate formate lyase activating enzyme
VAGTDAVLRFVARDLGVDTTVSLMAQYYPAHLAGREPEIARRITRKEWAQARRALERAGLADGWVQEYPDGLSPIAGTEVEPDGGDSPAAIG